MGQITLVSVEKEYEVQSKKKNDRESLKNQDHHCYHLQPEKSFSVMLRFLKNKLITFQLLKHWVISGITSGYIVVI